MKTCRFPVHYLLHSSFTKAIWAINPLHASAVYFFNLCQTRNTKQTTPPKKKQNPKQTNKQTTPLYPILLKFSFSIRLISKVDCGVQPKEGMCSFSDLQLSYTWTCLPKIKLYWANCAFLIFLFRVQPGSRSTSVFRPALWNSLCTWTGGGETQLALTPNADIYMLH